MVFTFPLLFTRDSSQSPKAIPTAILQRAPIKNKIATDNMAKGKPMVTNESIMDIIKIISIQTKKIKPIPKILK